MLEREPALVSRVVQEEGESEEENDDTNPHECVAPDEKRAQGVGPRRPGKLRLPHGNVFHVASTRRRVTLSTRPRLPAVVVFMTAST